MKKLRGALLTIAIMFCVLSISACVTVRPAEAKTIKAVSQWNLKKIKKIKTGTTTVLFGDSTMNAFYLAFTAPKTKTYTFTFSNLRSPKGNKVRIVTMGDPEGFEGRELIAAYITIENPIAKYVKGIKEVPLRVKTKGGTVDRVKICTQEMYDYERAGMITFPDVHLHNITKITKDTELPTRYAKIKLNKGQKVYLKIKTAMNQMATNTRINVKIK